MEFPSAISCPWMASTCLPGVRATPPHQDLQRATAIWTRQVGWNVVKKRRTGGEDWRSVLPDGRITHIQGSYKYLGSPQANGIHEEAAWSYSLQSVRQVLSERAQWDPKDPSHQHFPSSHRMCSLPKRNKDTQNPHNTMRAPSKVQQAETVW